jgi:hypothetical protein
MAQPQTFTAPDGKQIELTWATDEVLREILDVLNKDKKGDTKSQKANKKATDAASKGLLGIGKNSKSVGERMTGLDKKTSSLIDNFGKVEGTLGDVSQRMMGLIGVAGALGTAIGFAAGALDGLMDAQISAIQSGFSFSQQLIDSRIDLANIGLGFAEFSGIIAENGEAIRNLGATGGDATQTFSDMVYAARDATREMGMFGLSSAEIANEMADIVGTLVKAGDTGEGMFGRAVDSFSILNREVLGYAKLTGQNRRELMRNRGAVEGDASFTSAMGQLGEGAMTSAQNMTDAFTAAFNNGAGPLIDVFKGSVNNLVFGFQTMTNEQMGALQSVPGLAPLFQEYAELFVNNADNPAAMAELTSNMMTRISSTLGDQEEQINRQYQAFQRTGNPYAEFYGQLLTGITEGRTFEKNAEELGRIPFTEGITQTTAELISFKNELGRFITNVRTGVLTLFDVEDLGQLATKLSEWTDSLNNSIESIKQFNDDYFGGNGLLGAALVGGIAFLFGSKLVISGLVSAIGTLFGVGAVVDAMSGATAGVDNNNRRGGGGSKTPTAGASAAAGAGGSRLVAGSKALLGASKKWPVIGTAIAALAGVIDTEYREADYNLLSRSLLGITESLIDIGDLGANIITGAAGLAGFGPGWENDLNMSGSFKDFMTRENKPIAAFDPSTQSIPASNLTSIPGTAATNDGSIRTNVGADNAWRHNGNVVEDILGQIARDMAATRKEAERTRRERDQ